jgi:hypothetical protein
MIAQTKADQDTDDDDDDDDAQWKQMKRRKRDIKIDPSNTKQDGKTPQTLIVESPSQKTKKLAKGCFLHANTD